MEIVTTVVNPLNNEEVEVTLTVNASVNVSEIGSILNVYAVGFKEV
jgi:hypothetical protein